MNDVRTYPTRPFLAVSAAIFRDGKVLVVRRARKPALNLYTMPGGVVEADRPLVVPGHVRPTGEGPQGPVRLLLDRLEVLGRLDILLVGVILSVRAWVSSSFIGPVTVSALRNMSCRRSWLETRRFWLQTWW